MVWITIAMVASTKILSRSPAVASVSGMEMKCAAMAQRSASAFPDDRLPVLMDVAAAIPTAMAKSMRIVPSEIKDEDPVLVDLIVVVEAEVYGQGEDDS